MIKRFLALLLFFASFYSPAQQLSLFPDLAVTSNGYINFIADDVDTDGYFIASFLDRVNGVRTGNLAKIDHDGNVVPGFKKNTCDGFIRKVIPLTNGKILIAGDFKKINGVNYPGIVRLESDGSIDQTFTFSQQDANISDIGIQSDGKIVVVGTFTIGGFIDLVRLSPDGAVDNSFQFPNIVAFAGYNKVSIDTEDNIWACSIRSILRLEPDGLISTGFPISTGLSGSVYYIDVYGDQLYAAGPFTELDGVQRRHVSLINPDGTQDLNFTNQHLNNVTGIAVKHDGKLVISQLNTVDIFDRNGAWVTDVVQTATQYSHVDKNDNVVVSGGKNLWTKGAITPFLVRLTPTHERDDSFKCIASNTGGISAIAAYPDGRILVGGGVTLLGFGSGDKEIARINPDGTIDHTFDPEIPPTELQKAIKSLKIQQGGKILVTATDRLYRLTSSGVTDNTFTQGAVTDGAHPHILQGLEQRSDKLFLFGAFSAVNGYSSEGIIKLSTEGQTDNTFKSSLPTGSFVTAIAFQSNGKIVLVGTFPFPSGLKFVVRININGEIDNTFVNGSAAFGGFWDIGCDSHDNIYVTGGFTDYGSTGQDDLIKLLPDGVPDASFTPTLPTNLSSNLERLEIVSDNEILFAAQPWLVGERVIMALDDKGNLLDRAYTRTGGNSSITTTYFNGETLFFGGRISSEDNMHVSGVAVFNVVPVTASIGNLTATRSNDDQATLNWNINSVSNGNAIIVERALENDISFSLIAILDISATSYVDSDISRANAYRYRVKASNSGSSSSPSNEVSILPLPKLNQTINFANLPEKSLEDNPFTLTATASSGLSVSFTSSNQTVATINDNLVTILEEGTTIVSAIQNGDGDFNAAPPVQRTLRINLVTGIEDSGSMISSVYPNPGSGIFYVSMSTPQFKGSYKVRSLTEEIQTVKSIDVSEGIFTLDLTELAAGFYILEIFDGEKKSYYRVFKN